MSDIRQEISARVEKLPPELQAEVLRFVSSLDVSIQRGEPGAALLAFAGLLDRDSAREMAQAIEEDCETIDAVDW